MCSRKKRFKSQQEALAFGAEDRKSMRSLQGKPHSVEAGSPCHRHGGQVGRQGSVLRA